MQPPSDAPAPAAPAVPTSSAPPASSARTSPPVRRPSAPDVTRRELHADEWSKRDAQRAAGWRRLRSGLALVVILAVVGTVLAILVGVVLFIVAVALRHAALS